MNKSYIPVAFAMAAALSMVSCKNNNSKNKFQFEEPSQEEVQEMKQALANSVMAEIDALADQFLIASEKKFSIRDLELTEAEKMVKPDYLLDPAEANTFVTSSQKMSALGIYSLEYGIRIIYDMPVNETVEVLTKLAAELNFPVDNEMYENTAVADRTRLLYNAFKERGDLAHFWQYENAICREMHYVAAQNPDLVFGKITEEQWKSENDMIKIWRNIVEKWGPYDSEMGQLLEMKNSTKLYKSRKEREKVNSSLESAKEFHIANKDKYIAMRNALLK